MLEQPVRARFDPSGHQIVDVSVHRGYRPDSIRALAGVPLRIVFRRQDDDACSERVVFSAPRLDRRLSSTGTTTIDLPGLPAGEIRFTCGMGRYRGHIELVDEYRPPIRTRLRARASRLEAPLETALVLWICSLPLIALLAVVVLDWGAAIAAAGLVLVAWVTACLLASRRSTHPT
jgi:Uncharacterized protein conserved in bacteria